MNPRVSIITPCYNVGPYVERMIASVRAQTFTDWEHVLVDDGSTDDTAERIANAIAGEPRSRLIRQENRGVCAARNSGFRATSPTSEYVYFPDPDDMMDNALLATMVRYLDARPNVVMAFCGIQPIDLNDRHLPAVLGRRYVPTRYGVRALCDDEPVTPFASLYCWAPVPEAVAFIRRSGYTQTTGWDEAFGQHGESVILFPQLALFGEVHFVPARLYLHRVRPGQSSVVAGQQELAERRVLEWWRKADWLTPEQEAVVRQAEWFRYYRLDPWKGMRTATQHLKHRRLGRAARFALGAARRYLLSFFVPMPSPERSASPSS